MGPFDYKALGAGFVVGLSNVSCRFSFIYIISNNYVFRYLPPPVLDILSDKTLEATKRAAMITTALTWFFNNLPIDSLPPQVRPAALLLQRLAPYLGYIGTFISWSWSTIKSYDIGAPLIFHGPDL